MHTIRRRHLGQEYKIVLGKLKHITLPNEIADSEKFKIAIRIIPNIKEYFPKQNVCNAPYFMITELKKAALRL